jgi:Flp pilus assembly pilin Flp
MARYIQALWNDENGLTSVEYAILLALVVVAVLSSWQALGCNVAWTAFRAGSRLPTGASSSPIER